MTQTEIKTDSFSVVKINSRKDAIKHGKDRGWCTSDPDSNHYKYSYSKDKGDLFVIYKNGKKRPQYQLFISKGGSVEFRKKFNVIENINSFLSKDDTLQKWFNEKYDKVLDNTPRCIPPNVSMNVVPAASVSYQFLEFHEIHLEVMMHNLQMIHIQNESELPIEMDPNCLYVCDLDHNIHIPCGQFGFRQFLIASYNIHRDHPEVHMNRDGEYAIAVAMNQPMRLSLDLRSQSITEDIEFLEALPREYYQWTISRSSNQHF